MEASKFLICSAALFAGLSTTAVERSGTHQRGLLDGRQWLVAASHALTPRFVLDFGGARHRQGNETDHALFFGFTWLANPLFDRPWARRKTATAELHPSLEMAQDAIFEQNAPPVYGKATIEQRFS